MEPASCLLFNFRCVASFRLIVGIPIFGTCTEGILFFYPSTSQGDNPRTLAPKACQAEPVEAFVYNVPNPEVSDTTKLPFYLQLTAKIKQNTKQKFLTVCQ